MPHKIIWRGVSPACAKPRLPKPCAAGRRFGEGRARRRGNLSEETETASFHSQRQLFKSGFERKLFVDTIKRKNYIQIDLLQGDGWTVGKKPFSLLISTILFLGLLTGCDRPEITGVEFEKIDTSQDPIQTPYKSDGPITRDMKNGRFTITPVAEYKISGVVVDKETYSSDWAGKISPMDLTIAWGKLAEREYGRYVSYSHGNRWYFYQYKPGSPVNPSYIISHSSNNHIIPASENIRRAIKTIKRKEKVILEGYLVNLKGIYNGQTIAWNTSLLRTDTGSGSCELFYVSKVRIETRIYE